MASMDGLAVRQFVVTEKRETVEVTEENLEAVAEWCGGTVLNGRIRFGQHGEARVGEFIIRMRAGDYQSRDRAGFERQISYWTEYVSLHGGREVREDNLAELAKLTGGAIVYNDPPLRNGILFDGAHGFQTYAWPRDYIVPAEDGWDVVPERDLMDVEP